MRCQKTKNAARSSACQIRSRLMPLLLRIRFEHLLFHRTPDGAVELDKTRREPNLRNIARPRKIDAVIADGVRLGTCGEHDHAVRKRDRLFEVVRDEEHGLAVRRPKLEELVLHELAGL